MDPLDTSYATNRRFVVPDGWAPQRWGYNIVRLTPDAGATSVTVTFRGVVQSAANPDFRWGLVATDAGIATPRYSQIQKGTDGALTFCVSPNESLFLVVVATPSVQQHIVWDQLYNTIYRYPYMVQLANAWPDGWQGGTQAACPTGLVRVANGGGCGPSGLASTVFVGPYATVLSTATVSGNAQIQDHATIVKGTVTGGTVGALSLVGLTTTPANGFNVGGSAAVKTTFMPLGFFESGQSLERKRVADWRRRVPRRRLHRVSRDVLRLRRRHDQDGDQHHRRDDGRPVHLAELSWRAIPRQRDRPWTQDLDDVAAHAHQRARRAPGGRAAVEQIGSRCRARWSTASPVVAGGSPARFALVVVTGPPKRVTSARASGCGDWRTATNPSETSAAGSPAPRRQRDGQRARPVAPHQLGGHAAGRPRRGCASIAAPSTRTEIAFSPRPLSARRRASASSSKASTPRP